MQQLGAFTATAPPTATTADPDNMDQRDPHGDSQLNRGRLRAAAAALSAAAEDDSTSSIINIIDTINIIMDNMTAAALPPASPGSWGAACADELRCCCSSVCSACYDQ